MIPFVAYVVAFAALMWAGAALPLALVACGILLVVLCIGALYVWGDSDSGIYWPIPLAGLLSIVAGLCMWGVFG